MTFIRPKMNFEKLIKFIFQKYKKVGEILEICRFCVVNIYIVISYHFMLTKKLFFNLNLLISLNRCIR